MGLAGLSKEQLRALYVDCDANGDGQLTLDEFTEYVHHEMIRGGEGAGAGAGARGGAAEQDDGYEYEYEYEYEEEYKTQDLGESRGRERALVHEIKQWEVENKRLVFEFKHMKSEVSTLLTVLVLHHAG